MRGLARLSAGLLGAAFCTGCAPVDPAAPSPSPALSDNVPLAARRAQNEDIARFYVRKALGETAPTLKFSYLAHAMPRIGGDLQKAPLFAMQPEQLRQTLRSAAQESFEYERYHPQSDALGIHLRLARMQVALLYLGLQADGSTDAEEVKARSGGLTAESLQGEMKTTGDAAAGPALQTLLRVQGRSLTELKNAELTELMTISQIAAYHADAAAKDSGLQAAQVGVLSGRVTARISEEIGRRNDAELRAHPLPGRNP